MKKKLLSLLMAMVLCVSGTVVTQGTVAEAAMIEGAENFELGVEFSGRIEGYDERYFIFQLLEKSYVTLNTVWKKDSPYNYDCVFKIYSSEGEQVVKPEDVYTIYREFDDTYLGSIGRILPEGTYYLQVGTGSTGSATDVNFSFTIQAEPQIVLPKGVVSSLKTSKAGQMTVKCEESEDAIGYRIMYSTDYKFKKDVKTVMSDEPTKTISGLKKGAKYYVKVCPYTVYDDGTEVFGQNSKVKSIRVKK